MRDNTSRGVYCTAQLHEFGYSREAIRRLVGLGSICRITRGWYATPDADPRAAQAILAGGRLGCLSGAAAHGLWVPPHKGLHIMLDSDGGLPESPELVTHRVEGRLPRRANYPVLDCLAHIMRRHDPETALVVAESAVNLGLVFGSDVRGLIGAAPAEKRGPLSLFRRGAESGSETRLRLFFQRRHVPVGCQVDITGLGRVDLIVGRNLILEADSKAYHTGTEQYLNDRRRDLVATRLGYRVVRLTWEQVWLTWGDTQEALASLLSRRCHRTPPGT